MFVISVYGRACQGVESAAFMLAKSISASQLNAQALFFPSQDSVSPVFGQVKIDKGQIISRQIEKYDIALIFDKTLDTKSIVETGKERSTVILNSTEKFIAPLIKKKKMKSYFLNASDIALNTAGKPMPNIAMMGALAKVYSKLPMKNVRAIVEQNKEHLTSLDEGYKSVR